MSVSQTVSTRCPYPFLQLAPLLKCWCRYKHRTSLLLHWLIWLSLRSCFSPPVAPTWPVCLPHALRCAECWASAYRLRCLGLWPGRGTDTTLTFSPSLWYWTSCFPYGSGQNDSCDYFWNSLWSGDPMKLDPVFQMGQDKIIAMILLLGLPLKWRSHRQTLAIDLAHDPSIWGGSSAIKWSRMAGGSGLGVKWDNWCTCHSTDKHLISGCVKDCIERNYTGERIYICSHS
jgi:hypothetical protein